MDVDHQSRGSGKMPPPGSRFAEQYELLEIIGEGAVGVVYKARHLLMDKLLCLKILPGHILQNETANKRFLLERQALALLDHPNIARGMTAGISEDGFPFFSQELVVGKSLAELIAQQGHLDRSTFCRVFLQLFEALKYCHSKGIVHRDLKPSNILIDESQNLKLVDFGIAKNIFGEESKGATQTGAIVGSPAYMSPEQANAAEIDARSDIYSTGVLMYKCLTGRDLFSAESPMHLLYMHINQQPPELTLPSPNDFDLDTMNALLLKCLSKKADDRYQTVQELEQEFKRAVAIAPKTKKSSSKKAYAIIAAVVATSAFLFFAIQALKTEEPEKQKSLIEIKPINTVMKADKRRKAAEEFNGDSKTQIAMFEDAKNLFDEALKELKTKPDDYLQYAALLGKAKVLDQESAIYSRDNQYRTETKLREVLNEALSKLPESWHFERALVSRWLAEKYEKAKQYDIAEKLFDQAVALKATNPAPSKESSAYHDGYHFKPQETLAPLEDCYFGLAEVCAKTSNWAKEAQAYKKMYEVGFQDLENDHPAALTYCGIYVNYLLSHGELENARSKLLKLKPFVQKSNQQKWRELNAQVIAKLTHQLEVAEKLEKK